MVSRRIHCPAQEISEVIEILTPWRRCALPWTSCIVKTKLYRITSLTFNNARKRLPPDKRWKFWIPNHSQVRYKKHMYLEVSSFIPCQNLMDVEILTSMSPQLTVDNHHQSDQFSEGKFFIWNFQGWNPTMIHGPTPSFYIDLPGSGEETRVLVHNKST